MTLIGNEDRKLLEKLFTEELEDQVTLAFFTYERGSAAYENCEFCNEMESFLSELADTADELELAVYDFEDDDETRENYGIERAPAASVVGDSDYGIRYYGIPSGYEAQALIGDIVDVSARKADLTEDTRAWLQTLQKPVHLQVFVTPT